MHDALVKGSLNPATSTKTMLKNTYMLLSVTLIFSAICTAIAAAIELSPLACAGLGIGSLVPLFVTYRNQNKPAGIAWLFVFVGMMGASLGAIINRTLGIEGGEMIVLQALAITAVVFVSLSIYAIKSKRDFSYMGGFLFAALLVAFVSGLLNLYFQSPIMHVLLNAAVALIMVGYILYDTSRIVNGGETNYIVAVISLYLDIINLFVSLLNLLSAGDD